MLQLLVSELKNVEREMRSVSCEKKRRSSRSIITRNTEEVAKAVITIFKVKPYFTLLITTTILEKRIVITIIILKMTCSLDLMLVWVLLDLVIDRILIIQTTMMMMMMTISNNK